MHTISSEPSLRESVVLEHKGQKIFGVFHKPRIKAPYPTVLICHGLGGNKIGRYRIYVEIANQLAKQGIGSFRIDFRGCGDSDGEFHEMTLESELSDASVALDYIYSLPEVDQSRVGLFGRSLGGAVAMMAASQSERIKTLCLWVPIYSGAQWKDKWEKLHRDPLSSQQKEELMTVNGQMPGYEFYKQFFSLAMDSYISLTSDRPLFVIYGLKDELVHPSHSEEYIRKRQHAKAKTHVIQLPESDHDFTPITERMLAIEETAKWFTQTL